MQYDGEEYLATGYGHGRISLLPSVFSSIGGPCPLIEEVKPYLRPMSSMTKEELIDFQEIVRRVLSFTDSEVDFRYWHWNIDSSIDFNITMEAIDWLNAHHFDVRNLIGRGLAIDCTNLNIY